ncbi:MAG: class I adenylate-forming enzyme family protein [Acutalibacteraceae bacterium]
MKTVEIPVLARSREYAPANHNSYDYFLKNTEQYGEYTVFSHYGREHKKSELVADIEAAAAYYKKELDLKRGDVYTIFSPTNVESMILFMALNKLGVIVNFVHPLLPPENLREIMKFTKSKGVMVLDMFVLKYVDVIAEIGVPCLVAVPSTYALPDKYAAKADEKAMAGVAAKIKNYTTYPEMIKKYAGQRVEGVTENKDDVAIYANGGGTTGKSKTIKLTNSSLSELIYMLGAQNTPVEEIGVDTEICSMPFFHAYGFCAGGLSAMHKGAKVIFLPKFDADKFIDIMKHNKVTEFNGVPNMFKKLLAHPDFDGPHLKSIKVMYAGGDDVRPSFVAEFEKVMKKNGSKATICAGWGLTECCAACTTNPPWANKPGTIGKPLPGLDIQIWDENNQPLPQGEVGQIAVNGPTMMQGYLTEDGPIDAGLYKDENGKKWVLTGDLAYYDEDGYLVFMGRSKRLIIISGYNVYPGDIEKLLTELPFIKESCAVQGFDDEGKKLVRLYVVADGADEKGDEYKKAITDLCASRLDKFSVPRDIRFIDALPRTRLEKVDFMSLTEKDPE